MLTEAWYIAIGHMDYDEIKQAVVYFAQNDKREIRNFPPPSVLRDIISLAKKEKERIDLQIDERLRRHQPYSALPGPLAMKISEQEYTKKLQQMFPQIERKITEEEKEKTRNFFSNLGIDIEV